MSGGPFSGVRPPPLTLLSFSNCCFISGNPICIHPSDWSTVCRSCSYVRCITGDEMQSAGLSGCTGLDLLPDVHLTSHSSFFSPGFPEQSGVIGIHEIRPTSLQAYQATSAQHPDVQRGKGVRLLSDRLFRECSDRCGDKIGPTRHSRRTRPTPEWARSQVSALSECL